MKENTFLKVVLRILGTAIVIICVVVGALAVMSYLNRWYLQTDAWMRYGNFLFIAGVLLVIIGGFLVGGVRQMPMGQGAFIHLQVTGKETDLVDNRKGGMYGIVGYIWQYRVTISFVIAGITSIVIGIAIQSVVF